ncbi:bifunctional demethylmenaquinone methyltransferase/2-methoxy-6-polyprenyl-1,4-benzoquinol methylase UbiE [Chitinophagaceae bacterium LB-8]|uniref:Demethylmenaquinone methyltransferase n=1 Tax=Paraflavisolibacter caeni TaxID=2982496 RepID=A0A9X2XT38_9BACT|nr:bifunctional demethylmenaquinone methyltransferase/2-methoxy-6-polyprenyl-1,4-benzoquinol methylase UbiE [Paraflavisolibacter caeni]MCU7548035.1 bifunctional demethylmenaquinone methyltransferase/2-methoxy-6-polyprenyl-1,4-benzoquinol methylase UbiE [Paraflavisolibacter caeni]
MTDFPHDSIKPYDVQGGKKEQVSEMFDRIAGRYDFMNRFLSAGIDVSWRIKAIKELKKDQPQHILDVATGTGDMAIRACKMLHPTKITGIDISAKMLEIGRQKVDKEGFSGKIELLQGDSETINFGDNTFDAVMAAFGVRNFEHLEKGMSEILRVMKPGARLIVLEFSKPRIPGVRSLYNFYMGVIAPQIAKLFSQNKRAYQYLNESAKAFPDRKDFITVLNKAGYIETSFKPLTLGICCIYRGRKPA